jgi:hypothetical protein
MKKTVSILSLLVLLLGVWAAALWLSPFNAYNGSSKETRYGVHEGLELVEQENAQEGKRYVVEDEDGKELFVIPLRGCLLDTRYRNGQLRFREKNTKREGYIDRQGGIFLNENAGEYKSAEAQKGIAHLTEKTKGETISGDYAGNYSGDYSENHSGDYSGGNPGDHSREKKGSADGLSGKKTSALSQVDLKTMAQSNPFYKEASKIMQGKGSQTVEGEWHFGAHFLDGDGVGDGLYLYYCIVEFRDGRLGQVELHLVGHSALQRFAQPVIAQHAPFGMFQGKGLGSLWQIKPRK